MEKTLIVITGPTASGKSNIALQLAVKFKTAILSIDSRQIYKRMNIGTAKPSPADLELVPHFFIDHLDVDEKYSAALFEKDALNILDDLFKTKNIVIAAGGTGFYLQALMYGFDDIPKADENHILHYEKIFEEQGISPLQEELKIKDPDYFELVDKQNSRRLIRALSTIATTGVSFSSLRIGNKKQRPFRIIPICLEVERTSLYEKINRRVDQMISDGLESEVRAVQTYMDLPAMDTVGYKEFMPYFAGEYDLEETIRLIKRNTRRYAKRQMTWFRNREEFIFVKADLDDILQVIESKIS